MQKLETITQLKSWRNNINESVALVPTMGALHEGHLALIKRAKQIANQVIVSIFVNPTQFGEDEDLDKYPKTLDSDFSHCKSLGVDVVFMPSAAVMYPQDVIPVDINVLGLSSMLEGEFRPTHFGGVCRVCLKLFNLVKPDVVCFGQKDYQQLAIIRALLADLNLDIDVESIPIVRAADGLALSSRNRYLEAEDRPYALGLIKALRQAKHIIENNKETNPFAVEKTMQEILIAHHLQIDYAAIRQRHSLKTLDIIEPSITGAVIALVAAKLKLQNGSKVRLIDNMEIG